MLATKGSIRAGLVSVGVFGVSSGADGVCWSTGRLRGETYAEMANPGRWWNTYRGSRSRAQMEGPEPCT